MSELREVAEAIVLEDARLRYRFHLAALNAWWVYERNVRRLRRLYGR